ncbi:MAG: OsmC family protein [Proteobacteria bacterium]|nr:OsmC family protein [Pseudomonadota bacterium]MDA1355423.1 OsmC family protein [Pseudomonadota bacterium]
MTFDMPARHHFKIKAECPTHSRTDASVRHHQVVIDEPEIRGGTDAAASPLETMLSSYLACLNVISHLIAGEMGIRLDDMSMALDAEFDTNGISTQTPTILPFPNLTLTVNVSSDANDTQLAQLKSDLYARCPVTVIFTQAGSKIDSTWNVTRI